MWHWILHAHHIAPFRIVVPQPELTASEPSISSSTIIMPSEAPSLTTANVATINEHQAVNAASASHSASLDDISTIESDISEDSDASLWADARPAAPHSESEAEFVLVSDRSSTDGA
jgi:hypothetical protein